MGSPAAACNTVADPPRLGPVHQTPSHRGITASMNHNEPTSWAKQPLHHPTFLPWQQLLPTTTVTTMHQQANKRMKQLGLRGSRDQAPQDTAPVQTFYNNKASFTTTTPL